MARSSTAGEIVPFPRAQHLMLDWLELEHRRHIMHGLFEVDITEARRAIREYRARTGAPLSLTAFLVHCLARAVDADKAMQAYRLGRRRLVQFAGVDVLRRQKEEGPAEKLVAFVMEDPGIPRAGMRIAEGGLVTSGTLSPMLEIGIGLGYVPSGLAEPGSEITIDLRGRPRRARIVKKPFYRREES